MLRSSPIRIVGVDEDLTLRAARLRLRHYSRLSLADCYLIALAGKLRATIITTDSALRDVERVNVVLLRV